MWPGYFTQDRGLAPPANGIPQARLVSGCYPGRPGLPPQHYSAGCPSSRLSEKQGKRNILFPQCAGCPPTPSTGNALPHPTQCVVSNSCCPLMSRIPSSSFLSTTARSHI